MITHSVEETRQQKEQWGGGWRRGWGVKKKMKKGGVGVGVILFLTLLRAS